MDEVIQGRNTLGLLPTGGGKSICYQVPGLYFEGLTLVISPLIALIKDQVGQLKKVGIKAKSIHAGMRRSEIDNTLNNCILDKSIRFLFVSPERLLSEAFQEKAEQMNVKFLVIDEAHCISQWGYDFRPAYLNIIDIVEKLKKQSVPVLALTASATPEVQADIVEKLQLGTNVFIYKGEFTRENLSLNIRLVENKYNKLLEILRAVQGTSIVYVSSRKKAEEIARFLDNNQISALYYHAGLKTDERDKRQSLWINNQTRVIVATNAFGMGIDKSDVRTVVHFQLPSSLEAYYQEAGRAGRDGKKAFAVLLYNESDTEQLFKIFEASYPDFSIITRVYNALGNYFKLALGVRPSKSFDFNMNEIAGIYKIPLGLFYYSLKRLESIGVIALNDAFKSPSRVKILFNHQDLYRYQVANPRNEFLLKTLLRAYGANMFIEYLKINEQLLANQIKKGKQEVIDQMHHLVKQKVIDYQLTNENPQLTFLEGRCNDKKLKGLYAKVEPLKEKRKNALNQFVAYLSTDTCRSLVIAQYFGFPASICGVCDVCISNEPNHTLRESLLNLIKIKDAVSLPLVIEKLHEFPEKNIKKELRLMLDLGVIKMVNNNFTT